jgi:hypothetical protein
LIPTEGFATGTGGRYLNFGSGRNVRLHGRERVMTENEGQREDGRLHAVLSRIEVALATLPRNLRVMSDDRRALAR